MGFWEFEGRGVCDHNALPRACSLILNLSFSESLLIFCQFSFSLMNVILGFFFQSWEYSLLFYNSHNFFYQKVKKIYYLWQVSLMYPILSFLSTFLISYLKHWLCSLDLLRGKLAHLYLMICMWCWSNSNHFTTFVIA